MGEAFTKQFAAAKERTGEYFYSNQGDLESGKGNGWFGSWFKSHDKEIGALSDETVFEEIKNTPGVATSGSGRMTQTRAELRNATYKMKSEKKMIVQHGSFGTDGKDRDL